MKVLSKLSAKAFTIFSKLSTLDNAIFMYVMLDGYSIKMVIGNGIYSVKSYGSFNKAVAALSDKKELTLLSKKMKELIIDVHKGWEIELDLYDAAEKIKAEKKAERERIRAEKKAERERVRAEKKAAKEQAKIEKENLKLFGCKKLDADDTIDVKLGLSTVEEVNERWNKVAQYAKEVEKAKKAKKSAKRVSNTMNLNWMFQDPIVMSYYQAVLPPSK